MYKVVLFYKYVQIADLEKLMREQRDLCLRLGLKGRIIIAKEGINGTLEGKFTEIKQYTQELIADERFADVHFKFSKGNGGSFPKLSVKVRSEIVSGHLGENDVNPAEVKGKYVTAEQLHKWFEDGKELYIVDMRNDFEQEVGMFEGSIKSGMHLFKDLPQVVGRLENLKDKTVVTVCTGGVRCEKASGFLVKNGFADVYQLAGGIHTYMQKYPNEHFRGALYVFDGRIVMSFPSKSAREIIGKCARCGIKSENYVNCKDPDCNRHFIACLECSKNGILCPIGCFDYSAVMPSSGKSTLRT
jgi:UPF0176 protein